MTEHPIANDEVRERAGLFAAGALPPGEEAEFREHAKRCDVCAREARAFGEAAAWLALAAPPAAPPPQLRERLLSRIQEPAPPPGIRVVRAGESEWRLLIPGVACKRLYADSAGGSSMMLLRMDPGAQFPPHSHADVEHLYVLEGELNFGELVLRAGDYQCAAASTAHRSSHTVNGCMVLVVASDRNTMLPWNQ